MTAMYRLEPAYALAPGTRLAGAVLVSGRLLLKEGAILTEAMIQRLPIWGVDTVVVAAAPAAAGRARIQPPVPRR